MSKLSFADKLSVLFELTASSGIYIFLLGAFVFLGIFLASTKSRNKNRNKFIYIIVSVFLLSYTIITYHASLGNMFSYMMDNFFIVVYFPNIAIYFAAIITTNIILWNSVFNNKVSKRIRGLNVTIYIIINYLLILLLNVINTNKLDIFSQSSIYENKQATALIELSSIIFVVWTLFLIIYRIILMYIRKEYKPVVKKVIIKKKVKKLPENYEPVIIPDYVYGKTPHPAVNIEKPLDLNKLYEDREKQVELNNQYDKLFTLNDYKIMSKVLQEQKELNEKPQEYSKPKVEDEYRKQQEATTQELIQKIREKAEEEKQKRLAIEREKQAEEERLKKEAKIKALEEENKRREEEIERQKKIIEAEKLRQEQLIQTSFDEENKYQELLNLYRVR